MNHKALKNHWIKLDAKSDIEFNAAVGTILIPPENVRVFLHWLNDNGKLVSTHTLTYSTQVRNKIKIINPNAFPVSIHAIEL
jgi:hypothetical protein